MDERAGDTRREYSELFDVYWPIGVAVYLIVFVAVVVVVFRYRSNSDEFPGGKHKNTPLEGGYAFFLALIVAMLLYFTFDTMSDLESAERQATDGPKVEVTAARWSWRFEYPEYGFAMQGEDKRPATLVVPADTPVRFDQTSRDVIHSFWIPHLRFKRDAFPGRTTSFVLRFEDEGFHPKWGECAEFCGLLHTDMSFNVNVLPPDEFEAWARKRADRGPS